MKVVPATKKDIASILSKPLRQADVDEWVLGSKGQTVQKLLTERVILDDTRALRDELGECICLWGVCYDPDTNWGTLWLLATQEAESCAKVIARKWAREEARFFDKVPHLYAVAWDGNELHQHWLQRMGFEASGKVTALDVHNFTVFRKDRPCVDPLPSA